MIPGLDGLRAIAFLVLLCLHTGNGDFGWMGVQLFFVLSGFLITRILINMKDTLPAKEYFYKFYGRRFLRIFPLYFAYLFVLTIAVQFSDSSPWQALKNALDNNARPQLQYAFLYIYNFFHASHEFHTTHFLSHLWSLSVEEQFYIVWPLVLYFTPRGKIKHLLLGTLSLGPIFRTVIYAIYESHVFDFLSPNPYMAVYVLPFSHIDAFAMGAYASSFHILKPRQRLIILAFMIPLLGFLTQYISKGRIQLNTLGYEFTLFSAYKFVWGYSVLNYFFALLILAVTQENLFTNILEHFTLRYIGKISYGLYVYHYPVVGSLLMFQSTYREQIGHSLYLGDVRLYFTALIITTIIAGVSFHFFERPINNLKDRLFPLSELNGGPDMTHMKDNAMN